MLGWVVTVLYAGVGWLVIMCGGNSPLLVAKFPCQVRPPLVLAPPEVEAYEVALQSELKYIEEEKRPTHPLRRFFEQKPRTRYLHKSKPPKQLGKLKMKKGKRGKVDYQAVYSPPYPPLY